MKDDVGDDQYQVVDLVDAEFGQRLVATDGLQYRTETNQQADYAACLAALLVR